MPAGTAAKTANTKPVQPSLSFVKPSDNPHLNVLLYGPPKTGKSVGAASVPGPTLLLNADSPNATRFAHAMWEGDLHEAPVEGLQTLITAMQVIDSGEFKSVVVDPVGEVYRILLEEISGRALSPAIQNYGDAGTHLERFIRALCEKPVNAVFVAHETSLKNEADGTFERLPWTGTNNPALGAKMMAMVDVIGYTGIVQGEGDAPDRYMATLVNANGRRGGDRTGQLGSARETNLSEWVELAKPCPRKRQQNED